MPTASGPVDTRDIDEGRPWKGGTGTATTDGTPTLFPDARRDGRETLRCSSLTGGRGLKGGTVTAGALLMACDTRKRDHYSCNIQNVTARNRPQRFYVANTTKANLSVIFLIFNFSIIYIIFIIMLSLIKVEENNAYRDGHVCCPVRAPESFNSTTFGRNLTNVGVNVTLLGVIPKMCLFNFLQSVITM
jgi:hypothetical protein